MSCPRATPGGSCTPSTMTTNPIASATASRCSSVGGSGNIGSCGISCVIGHPFFVHPETVDRDQRYGRRARRGEFFLAWREEFSCPSSSRGAYSVDEFASMSRVPPTPTERSAQSVESVEPPRAALLPLPHGRAPAAAERRQRRSAHPPTRKQRAVTRATAVCLALLASACATGRAASRAAEPRVEVEKPSERRESRELSTTAQETLPEVRRTELGELAPPGRVIVDAANRTIAPASFGACTKGGHSASVRQSRSAPLALGFAMFFALFRRSEVICRKRPSK